MGNLSTFWCIVSGLKAIPRNPPASASSELGYEHATMPGFFIWRLWWNSDIYSCKRSAVPSEPSSQSLQNISMLNKSNFLFAFSKEKEFQIPTFILVGVNESCHISRTCLIQESFLWSIKEFCWNSFPSSRSREAVVVSSTGCTNAFHLSSVLDN